MEEDSGEGEGGAGILILSTSRLPATISNGFTVTEDPDFALHLARLHRHRGPRYSHRGPRLSLHPARLRRHRGPFSAPSKASSSQRTQTLLCTQQGFIVTKDSDIVTEGPDICT
ncbi:hypothetical protein ACOMHN_035608 [Nucella lapillus]